jgi:hypothetical protein
MGEKVAQTRIVPVGAIRRRSQQLRIGLVACLAAVGLGIYGVPKLVGGESSTEPGSAGGTETAEVVMVDAVDGGDPLVLSNEAAGMLSDLDWEQVDSTLGWVNEAVVSGDVLYALSTEPGVNGMWGPPPQAIYSSNDGITWDWQPVGEDIWVSDIGVHENTLYAITTAPGTAEEGVTGWIMSSTDQGANWDTVELELPGAGTPTGQNVEGMHTNGSVVAGPNGVMAVFTTFQYGRAGESSVVDGFFSEDGKTFAAASAPFTGWVRLVATEGGFLALEEPMFEGTMRVWFSADGGDWEALSSPNVDWVRAAGEVEGRIVVVGEGRSGSSVAFSEDRGATWSEVDLAGVTDFSPGFSWIQAVDIGPHGLVLCLGGEFGLTSIVATEDFATWSELPLDGLGNADFVEAMWVLNSGDEVVLSLQEYAGERSRALTLIGSG